MSDRDDAPELRQRFGERPSVRAAIDAIRQYESRLSELTTSEDDQQHAAAEARIGVVESALAAFETVEPAMLDDNLANALKKQAENANNHTKQHGAGSQQATQSQDALHGVIRQLVSIPAAGEPAEPLAYRTEEARNLIDKLEKKVEGLEARNRKVAQTTEEAQTEFRTLLEEGSVRVDELKAELTTRVETATTEVREAVEADRVAFAKQAEAHDQEADELLQTLRDRVSRSADDALAAGYGNAAKREERAANWLRVGAVLAVLGVVALAAWTVNAGSGGDLAWSDAGRILGRGAALVALGVLARYLAVEGSGHRAEARRLRQVELELANLDEYLSALDPEQRKGARENLLDRYFRPDAAPDADSSVALRTPQEDFIEQLRQVLYKDRSDE